MRCSIFSSFIFLLFILISCKEEKNVLMSGEGPVEVNDFVNFFPLLNLNYQLTEEDLKKSSNDSLLISRTVFKQFVPDSVIIKFFGKAAKPKFYPVGKVQVNEKETYLLVNALSGSKTKALLIFLGEKNEFLGAAIFLDPDTNLMTQQISSIDKRFSISKTVLRKNEDGSVSDGKDVYVFDIASRSMILIMTDALDEKNVDLINPIDTLSSGNKFSADYRKDKKNLVSIRDGRKAGMIYFFIHIESKDGECTGELKGEASFINSKTAVYKQSGDPCSIELFFSSSAVRIKETGACGSRHGLDCKFDGSFAKKKNPGKK